MKLHSDPASALNTVTAYGDDYIEVNLVRYDHAVWFGPEGPITEWQVRDVADITTERLREAAGIVDKPLDPMAFLDEADSVAPTAPPDAPEVMLVGTGARQRLLHPSVYAPLTRLGIGVEAMDTQAAARTYNILMAEGRRVVVALMPMVGVQK